MDEETTELRNPFPSPPSHYTKFTSHNLNLLALLKERSPDYQNANQYDVLNDQSDIPDWPLTQLEKPRVDWILEEPDAYFDVYGDRWFVKDTIPSLAEVGGHQLYPADPSVDRRPALLSVLRTLLVTYSALMGSLLVPPPLSPETPPEWDRHISWITVLSQNLMAAVNDLRPVQARDNLESMMKRQLELRREETKKIHEKCDSLTAKLDQLRGSIHKMLADSSPTTNQPHQPASLPSAERTQQPAQPGDITNQDVLRWAEQV
ncbi:MED7 protein-domain-containing protein [Panaeolus papilionaceus]|nr:MED7 protein-domain-containing protein [Panaeolus papilionaceus]